MNKENTLAQKISCTALQVLWEGMEKMLAVSSLEDGLGVRASFSNKEAFDVEQVVSSSFAALLPCISFLFSQFSSLSLFS